MLFIVLIKTIFLIQNLLNSIYVLKHFLYFFLILYQLLIKTIQSKSVKSIQKTKITAWKVVIFRDSSVDRLCFYGGILYVLCSYGSVENWTGNLLRLSSSLHDENWQRCYQNTEGIILYAAPDISLSIWLRQKVSETKHFVVKLDFCPKRNNWQLGKYLIYIQPTELYRTHGSNILHMHFTLFRFFPSNGAIRAQFTHICHFFRF
jgi:hypothetical protein